LLDRITRIPKKRSEEKRERGKGGTEAWSSNQYVREGMLSYEVEKCGAIIRGCGEQPGEKAKREMSRGF